MRLDSTGGVCMTESERKALDAIGSSGNLSCATYRGKSELLVLQNNKTRIDFQVSSMTMVRQ